MTSHHGMFLLSPQIRHEDRDQVILAAAGGTSVLDVLAQGNMQAIAAENPAELLLASFLHPGVVGKENDNRWTEAEKSRIKMLQIRVDLLILLPFRSSPAHGAALPAVNDG